MRELILEPIMHPRTNMLSIPKAVLHKSDIGRREQIEIHLVVSSDSIDSFVTATVVPLVPRSCREGVGVADQYSIRRSCQFVLSSLLFPGDVDKLLVTPTGRWVFHRQAL